MAMHPMAVRRLGDLGGSALGFGCMSLTPGFLGSGQDLAVSEKVLRKALDSGIRVLNTADFYTGLGEGDEVSSNIKFIGKVVKDYERASIVLTMKWGPWVQPGKGFCPVDLSPTACKDRVANALKLLGVDYIDALILRLGMGPDVHGTPIEDTAKAMKELVEEGKVRAIGISEAPMEDAKKIHSVVPVSVVELRWALCSRDAEKELIPWARSVGAGILAYSPMGAGVLTGKLDLEQLHPLDMRLRHPVFKAAYAKNLKIAAEVEKLAAKKGCTAGQLALAWVLAQGEDVIPIPGTKTEKYLLENLKALDIKLTASELEELSNLDPPEES